MSSFVSNASAIDMDKNAVIRALPPLPLRRASLYADAKFTITNNPLYDHDSCNKVQQPVQHKQQPLHKKPGLFDTLLARVSKWFF